MSKKPYLSFVIAKDADSGRYEIRMADHRTGGALECLCCETLDEAFKHASDFEFKHFYNGVEYRNGREA